jgi:uncharacterized protein involved in exopolysaccharide biosynthesis
MLPRVEESSPRRHGQVTGVDREGGRVVSEVPLENLRRLIAATGKWLVLAAVVGAVIGGLLMFLQPIRYDAVATLMVSQPKFSADAKPINVSTFRALLETNALASSAIAEFHLDAPPSRMVASDFLRDTLIVEEVRNTNLLRVRARMTDSKLVAELANYIALEAIKLNEEIDQQESVDFRGQLRSQLDAATKRLRAAEERLLEFRKRSQLDLAKRDADAALDQRGELLRLTIDIEAEKARLASAEKEIQRQDRVLLAPRMVQSEAALRSVPAVDPPAPSLRVPQQPETSSAKESDNRVRERRPGETRTNEIHTNDTRANNTRGNNGRANETRSSETPRSERSVSETEEQERQIAAGAGLDLTNPFINPVYQVLDYQIALSRTRLAGLERRRRELVGVQRLGGDELTSLATLYPQQIQLRRLETEHELAETVYSEVAVQYERARLQVASVSARLQLIDKAIEPTNPLPRHGALGAVLGGLAGLAVALMLLAIRQVTRVTV